jgi:predicted  nucleic acid-binding Zn-ribbon protein
MQVKLMRLEQSLASVEGMDAIGLVQQNYDLKKLCEQERLERKELERKLEFYLRRDDGRKLVEIPVQVISTLLFFVFENLIFKRVFQAVLVQELGIQLEQKRREVDMLEQQLDVERHGRRHVQVQINSLLNDFVICCQQIPDLTSSPIVNKVLNDLLTKCGTLVEFGEEIAAAIQVALDDSTKIDFLREISSETEDIPPDISLAEAVDKIANLLGELRLLKREAKNQVIEQMRKQKLATIKAKDLSDKLQKSEADRCLAEERLGNEVSRLRSELDEFRQSLGNRSSYATKAVQSVRALIDLMEGQKLELQSQRDDLRAEVISLRHRQDELTSRNKQLEVEISRLNATAMEEATARVSSELSKLNVECARLREEVTSSREQLESTKEKAERHREEHQSATAQIDKLGRQIQTYESEIKDLRTANATLTKARQQTAVNVKALVGDSQSRQDIVSMQQSTAGSGVSYWARELPKLERLSRSPRSVSSVSRQSDDKKQERFSTAAPVIGDTMTQSLPPTQSLYSRYSFGQVGQGHPDDNSSTSTVSGYQSLSPLAELVGMNRARTDTSENSRRIPSRPQPQASGTVLYSRSAGLKSFGAPSRDTMQCLRCGSKFPITNLDSYERHIRDCYSDVDIQ